MDINIQSTKQRFGIIGNHQGLNRALSVAVQVAPTNISVLVTGESGTGKEIMPQVIHQNSNRKHNEYIAVNCGAIPEGTIDSELFGHEKGAFTGAHDNRKGYFEVANGGTIFLDEVAELPLTTQVRLLRVLETGEFIKVGSSKVQKTDVRIIAATNVDLQEAIRKNKFREDLYYRLNTIPINLPPLRERQEDIEILFRKFASDFAERYRMPNIRLNEESVQLIKQYPWPGNIRQLKNVAEQISVVESERNITAEILSQYIPSTNLLPMVVDKDGNKSGNDFSEREILYKVLFDMRQDITDLKKLVLNLLSNNTEHNEDANSDEQKAIIKRLYQSEDGKFYPTPQSDQKAYYPEINNHPPPIHKHIEVEESLSLADQEKDLIIKALEKYKGKRKKAANELGISERTLYRKIKEYNI